VEEQSPKKSHNWSLALSIVAVGISGFTLWLTSLRPADLRIYVGESIAVGYLGKEQELMVAIPTVISNAGAGSGLVQSMGLMLSDAENSNKEAFFLKWHVFGEFDPEFVFTQHDRVVPISVHGRASTAKYVVFKGASEFARWVPEAHTYSFSVVAWTKPGVRPDCVRTFRVTFSEEDSATLRQFVADDRKAITWVNRDEFGGWRPKMLSAGEAETIRRTGR
jgi:hypothetical protein